VQQGFPSQRPRLAPPAACADADAAQCVEAIRLHPQVGIRDPHASGAGVIEPGNGFVNPAVRGVYEADPASGHPLPTRVSDLTAEGERGLEGRSGLIDPRLGQIDLCQQ
jgi:hypothetical protein